MRDVASFFYTVKRAGNAFVFYLFSSSNQRVVKKDISVICGLYDLSGSYDELPFSDWEFYEDVEEEAEFGKNEIVAMLTIKDSCFDECFINSVSLLYQGAAVEPLEPKDGMRCLFPISASDCKDVLWFSSSPRRPKDERILSFIGGQVSSSDFVSVDLRINAKVVQVYKLIECEDDVGLSNALDNIDSLMNLSAMLPRTDSSKTDSVFLKLSLQTAYWHALLFLGKRPEAVSVMEEVSEFDYSNENLPVFAYNVACAKSFLSLYYSFNGLSNKHCFESLRELFFDMVARRTYSYGWFGDYGTVHKMVYSTWSVIKSLDEKGFVTEKVFTQAVSICLRVKKKNFVNKASFFYDEEKVSHAKN